MSRRLAAIMYHYVRPLARTRFPAIKGLDLALFRAQLDHLQRHATIIPAAMLFDAASGAELPPRAVLLTFDDGYADHYAYVFPELCRRGLTGAFFPPAAAVRERVILDVNKVHFTLAAVADAAALAAEMEDLLRARAAEFDLQPLDAYRRELWVPNRFDPPEVNYLKRMLQHALPVALRGWIADRLFERHVCADQGAFAEELYVSLDQLRVMRQAGMVIGGHGDRHVWLDRVEAPDLACEIDAGTALMDAVGMPAERWSLCYPYGANSPEVLRLLAASGCRVAFTSDVGLADFAVDSPLLLPRLDTNHLPKDAALPPGEWLEALAP